MNITLKQIKRFRDVCDGEGNRFLEKFPDGIPLTIDGISRAVKLFGAGEVGKTVFYISKSRLSQKKHEQLSSKLSTTTECEVFGSGKPCVWCASNNEDKNWKVVALQLLKASFPSKRK